MKVHSKWLLSVLMPAVSAAFLMASGSAVAVTGIDGGYVGTSVCTTCHPDYYADFSKSGHPYKYRHTGGLLPVNATPLAGEVFDPLSSILLTPATSAISTLTHNGLIVDTNPADGKLDWSAINYAVGGFGWKARYGILDPALSGTGYVWTGSAVQFNMLAADPTLDPQGKRPDFSAYNAGTDKKYECAKCHNTNGTVLPATYAGGCGVDPGGRTQPWLNNPGMSASFTSPSTFGPAAGGYRSEWTFDSVQCEACHGPGETHSNAPTKTNIGKNSSREACGTCHTRAADDLECYGVNLEGAMTNGAADGFLKHHEQYNELVGTAAAPGVHATGAAASMTCVNCHNPHKRSHKVTGAIASILGITDNNLSAEERGAIKATGTCEYCHPGKILRYNMGNIKCIDCHMAEATKSATGEKGIWGKMGDVKTHIFKIDPSAAHDGTVNSGLVNSKGKPIAANYLTVDYACGKCHDSSMSTFTGGTALDTASAQLTAQNMHLTKPVPRFIWGMDPAVSYKVNFNAGNTTCMSGNCSYSWDFGDSADTTPGTGITPSHLYGGTTAVTVKLTVNDTTLLTTASTSRTVTPAYVNQPPAAAGLAGATLSNYTVSFTDASTDPALNNPNGITAVTVNWRDGTSSSGAAGGLFSHTYATAGTYTILHTATDAARLSASETRTLAVPQKFGISGTVSHGAGSFQGVLMILKYNGNTKATTTTAADGGYSFTNVLPGAYAVQPYKSGYTFTPATATVTVGPDATGVDFTATP